MGRKEDDQDEDEDLDDDEDALVDDFKQSLSKSVDSISWLSKASSMPKKETSFQSHSIGLLSSTLLLVCIVMAE
jgi:hypothetical protein